MDKQTLSRESVAIIGLSALAMFALALLSPAIFNDGDTYWHIRAGQWMLAHRAVLTTDPFSLSFAGRPWETQEWLAEIGFAGAFRMFRWSGVAILTGLAMAAATAALAAFLVRRLDPVPSIVVLVLALGCVMPDFLARPHILALPCVVVWIAGLADAAEARRPPRWALLLPMVLWVNLHGSFIFGLALIAPFAIEAALADRTRAGQVAGKWMLFAAAAAAATLLNPRGLAGVLFPFHLMGLKSLAAIGEWQSPDFHAVGPVEMALFAGVFFFIWRGIRISAVRLVLILALAALWLQHARYGILLGITGAVLTAAPLAGALKSSPAMLERRAGARLAYASFAAMFVVLAALRVAWPVKHVDDSAAALAAVPASVAKLPVFNNYAFGGLLIFDGIRPSVDSRADLYGDAWLDRYARAIDGDENTVNTLFRNYRIAWTMLEPGDPLVSALDRRPGWRRIYADAHTVIQAGPDALAALGRASRTSGRRDRG
ncbi:MAG: hypothetical protein ACREHF_13320 [Rhizomicrobium sp.]